MEAIREENIMLAQEIQDILFEIEKQKEKNDQHQTQIQTLLRFNDRLLAIIEQQISLKRPDNASLQPISEQSERESDLVNNVSHSYMKTKKIVARSEKGAVKKPIQNQQGHISGNKLNIFDKSQIDESLERDDSVHEGERVGAKEGENILKQKEQNVKREIQSEITQLRNQISLSSKFFDDKIDKLEKINKQIGVHPQVQFQDIAKKVQMSPTTAALVRKAMLKHMM